MRLRKLLQCQRLFDFSIFHKCSERVTVCSVIRIMSCLVKPETHNVDLFYDTILDLVKKAGQVIKEKTSSRNKSIEVKSSNIDFVTETDQQVEKLVIDSLSKQFPDHKFIGEESVASGSQCSLTNAPTWIIDPIDGTMNFVHSFPHSCISVGLFINQKPTIGVIYNPMLNQLFTARKGKGAFLNGERITSSGKKSLVDALLMFEFGTSRDEEKMKVVRENQMILSPQVHGYFATGCNLKALSCYFLRGHTTIREIIATTSEVIWKHLQPAYLPTPTKETWLESARRYWELWNLPNCVGSVDGKHIRIRRPPKSGSEFINYKGYICIVLMAVSDADGCFLTIDVGEYGRNSDGRALKESNFGNKLLNGTLDLPDPTPLPGQDKNFPFYFAADEAFPLMYSIMKPYPKRGLTNRKRVFNGRLSRGRKSVECSFGMMSSKFRILHTTIALNVNRVDIIVQAICVLHNFIKKEEGVFSRPRGKKGNDSDIEVENEEQQRDPRFSNQRRATNPAIATREKLCDFFFTVDGSLKDQKRFCV